MALLSLYILISYFFLDCCVVLGQVLQNRTFDDNDPAIRYTGQWSVKFEAGISLNTGGAHMYTQDPNAQAAFKFTGVAVYFLSPLWPYDVTTKVQLDSRSPEILNLKDFSRPDTGGGAETVAPQVVWSAEGLPNGLHVLTMSVGVGEEWAIVDGFIVTFVNESIITAQSTTTQGITTTQSMSLLTGRTTVPVTASVSVTKVSTLSLDPAVTPPPSPSIPRGKNALIIGLPSAIGFLALIIVILICYYFYRQQFKRRRHHPRLNLEEEFPFIPRSPPTLSIPPWSATQTVNSQTPPETVLVVQSPEQEYYPMVPLAAQQSRNSLNTSSTTASRRSIRAKPPSYDESVAANRRARREVLLKSSSVNPD